MAAVIAPVSKLLKRKPVIVRGGIYTCGIYLMEFATGCLLKRRIVVLGIIVKANLMLKV